MPTRHAPWCSRFPLIVLTVSLVFLSPVRFGHAADLTASSADPRVNFDDTTTAVNPDWLIVGNSVEFSIGQAHDGGFQSPFSITRNAPPCSLCVNDTGNVGLGTSVPAQKLHLVSGLNPTIRFEQDSSQGLPAHAWHVGGNHFGFFVYNVNTNSFPLVLDATTGRAGFGTDKPQGNLHIFGDADQDIFNGIGPDLNNGPAFNFGYSGNSFGPGSGFFNVRGATSGVNPSLRFATVNVQRMIITNTGRVGIGTLAPAQPLHVSGNIRTDGSFIAGGTTLNVPDYVFEPDYKLMPLTTLASYVEREKHLPDIPSAQEIKTQGVNMSELQMQLLKKVEELTLYTVEQEKTIRRQEQAHTHEEQTMHELKEMVAHLTARVATLEHRPSTPRPK